MKVWVFIVVVNIITINTILFEGKSQPYPPRAVWGIITDEYGNRINGVNVTLINQRTGETLYNISYYDSFSGGGTYIFALDPEEWQDGDNVTVSAYKPGVGLNESWFILTNLIEQINITLFADTNPPVTTISFGTPHYNNYISSSTQIFLYATDDLSGVNKTYYRIWNGTWTPWYEYTQPFNIEEDCMHYIEFYSTDNTGNTEAINNVTVYVDNSPPVANAGSDKEGFVGQLLQFNASSSYDEKSGIASYEWNFGDGNIAYGEIVYHSYSKSGIYTVTLTVTDNLGHSSTDTIEVTIYENFTFELKEGWNLICLPLNTTYTTAEELGQAIGANLMAKWNAETQQWIAHPVGGPCNFQLNLGEAYFIHITENITFTIHGLPYNVSYTLYPGWNFIGWFGKDDTTAEELGQAIGADTVAKWNVTSQHWITHPVGGPSDFVITRGEGICLHILSSSPPY